MKVDLEQKLTRSSPVHHDGSGNGSRPLRPASARPHVSYALVHFIWASFSPTQHPFYPIPLSPLYPLSSLQALYDRLARRIEYSARHTTLNPHRKQSQGVSEPSAQHAEEQGKGTRPAAGTDRNAFWSLHDMRPTGLTTSTGRKEPKEG